MSQTFDERRENLYVNCELLRGDEQSSGSGANYSDVHISATNNNSAALLTVFVFTILLMVSVWVSICHYYHIKYYWVCVVWTGFLFQLRKVESKLKFLSRRQLDSKLFLKTFCLSSKRRLHSHPYIVDPISNHQLGHYLIIWWNVMWMLCLKKW